MSALPVVGGAVKLVGDVNGFHATGPIRASRLTWEVIGIEWNSGIVE